MKALLTAILLSTASLAHAAEIRPWADGAVLVGEIERHEDVSIIRRIEALHLPKGSTIHLNSTGGYVYEAMAVGYYLSSRQYRTAVDDRFVCYSACALIWTAGVQRYMSGSATIGFHEPAYVNGQIEPTADRDYSAYLYYMGVQTSLIDLLRDYRNDRIYLLTRDDARAMGRVQLGSYADASEPQTVGTKSDFRVGGLH